MPSVIRLTKSDLIEFAQVAVLANTPLSLFKGMVRCAGMTKLRKASIADLTALYDSVTARAGRSEFVVGLAYAVLCAIVLHARETPQITVDASRLNWGKSIWDFMKRAHIGTDNVDLKAPQQPTISSQSSPSTETRVSLYGADGQPISWRNQ